MNALWSYFWPVFAVGLVVGAIAGTLAYRKPRPQPKEDPIVTRKALPGSRRRLVSALVAGCAICIAAALLWHGPLGAADRYSSQVERIARQVLVNYEAPAGVAARVHHGPLTRQLILSGPGDDFQRGETARLLGQIPGVSDAVWVPTSGIPLIVEGVAVALLGFLFGLLLAYLVELRRRYNMQWNW
jgi:hypothetical protein